MSGVYPDGVEVRRHARISDDGAYRYTLQRDWHESGLLEQPTGHGARTRFATFVMLNPSTADAEQDDPTIRRCVGFARALGCDALAVVNLYAYRATKPDELWKVADPVGPANDSTLQFTLTTAARCGFPIIAAWGAHAKKQRVAEVLEMPGADRLMALGFTKDGAPKHPLYLPSSARPMALRMARTG